jgi:SOS response regulatory protein OraA/RecX
MFATGKSRSSQPKKKPELKKRLLNLILYRPSSSGHLRTVLRKDGYDSAEIDEALSWASTLGYVNDRKLAAGLVEKLRKTKQLALPRIRLELLRKEFNDDVIDEVFNELDPDADKDLCKLAAEMLLKRTGANQDMKTLSGRLRRQGFSWSQIYGTLRILGITNTEVQFEDSDCE